MSQQSVGRYNRRSLMYSNSIRRICHLGLLLLLSCVASSQGASAQTSLPPLVVSRFNSGDEGWRTEADAVNAPIPQYVSTGGSPGGYIQAIDSAQNRKWYWNAPAKFHGNLSQAYGRVLTFQLKSNLIENPTDDIDVSLVGGGLTLVFDTAYNPGQNWTPYTIPLLETSGWRKDRLTGQRPTAAEMRKVLGAVTKLRIRGDYIFGADSTGLDNVEIGGGTLLRRVMLPLVYMQSRK